MKAITVGAMHLSIYIIYSFTFSSIYLYLIIYLPFLRRIFDGVIESGEANQQS